MNRDTLNRFFGTAGTYLYNKGRSILGDELPTIVNPLSQELPPTMMSRLPYLGWDEVNQLYQNENTCGLLLEVTPLGDLSEGRHNILGQIFSDGLPDGVHVQVINWSSPKVGHILNTWSDNRAAGGGIFEELARHRRQHLKNGVWNTLCKSEPMFVRDYRVFLAFELKGETQGEAGRDLREVFQVIDGTYRSLGGAVRILKPNDLLDLLRAFLNPTSNLDIRTEPYDTDRTLREQVMRKDTTINVFRDRIITSAYNEGDRYGKAGPHLYDDAGTEAFEIRAFGVEKFPDNSSQAVVSALCGDFFNAQLQPQGSTLTCLYFTPWTFERTKSFVELKSIRMNQQASGPQGKFFPAIMKSAKDWEQANSDMSRGVTLADMALLVISTTPEGEGEKAERALRSVFTSAGFRLDRYDCLQLDTLLACMPMTMGQGRHDDWAKLKRLRMLPTSAMVLLAPLQGEFSGSRTAHMLLLGRRGQPFFWSPFSNGEDGGAGGNHNVSVIGSSGSGKSFFMQEMAGALRGSGADIMVLDDGRSFENTCKIQNGQYIEFTLNSGLCINPFSMFDHQLAACDEEYKDECRESIRSLVLQMARGERSASKEEIGAISQSVNHVWDTLGRNAGIHDVAAHLKDTQGEMGRSLHLAMSEFIEGGSYYNLYNGLCSLKIENPFTVFELSPIETKKELRACVILGLLMLIRQRMKHGGRSLKKALFIDEAWQLLGDGAAGPFIEGFARRVRKEGGALITGTQQLSDYQRTAGGQACIANSDWNIILRLKEEALNAFEKEGILQATEGDMRVMRSLKTISGVYSEAFIRGPGWKSLGRLTVDPYTATLYSTNAETMAHLESLVRSGVPVAEAVRQVAYNVAIEKPIDEGEMHRARLLLRMDPIRQLVDDYLSLGPGDAAKFLRRVYKDMGLKNAA
jgi:conjugal transfer ATP-binding protein TraC